MTLRRTTVLAAAVLAALAAGWWVAGGANLTGSAGRPAQAPSPDTFAAAANLPGARQSPTPGRQLVATSAEADVFLKDDLRFRFEALLLETGEATSPSALKMRLAALLPGHFVAGDRARALALLNRYVNYRVALGDIKEPADASDPHALRVALEARQRLREKHFDSGEYSALFADEEELDRYTLARLEIERNPALTPAQRQTALRQAESGLSETQRTARTESLAHEAVAVQTAAFDSQGASAQDRHVQRREQYGDAAAQQLARLDSEEKDWQTRLNTYADAKKNSASPAQIEQLQRQLFSAEEQLRIEAALVIRQQQQAAAVATPSR